MGGWITDRKPEEGKLVLVTTEDDFMEVAYWDEGYWWHDGNLHRDDWVQAWMPLPEPYDRRLNNE